MKYFSIYVSALLVLVFASPVMAEPYVQYGMYGSSTLVHAFGAARCANVIWPSQYIPAARRSVLSTYEIMTNNGWRRQNLLGAYHFDPETNELTEAGKLKVNWILTQAPEHRRSIFVERGRDQSDTATRVASVHSWSSTLSPAIAGVDVNDTHIIAEGHPAGVVDNIFVGFQSNQRPPVLPTATSSTGGGGSTSSQQ